MNTMAFSVEKAIRRLNSPNALKYPWPKLWVGDSFLVPLAAPDRKIATSINNSSAQWGGRHGGEKFALEWSAGPRSGYRVWRVA